MANKTEIFYIGHGDRTMSNIAYVALAALCLSPMPTIIRIWKRKSTEEFHPYPYMAALPNSFVWLLYSAPFKEMQLPIPFRSRSLYICNLIWIGFLYFYLATFYVYTTARNRRIVAFTFFPVMFLLFCTITFVWTYWSHTTSDKVHFISTMQARLIGPIGVVSGIIMYGCPLSIMRRIYVTNCVEYLPYWPCVAYIFYGLAWFVYACLPPVFDPYIAITNGVGALLGLLQLVVHYKFLMSFEEVHARSEEARHAFHLKV